MGDDVQNTYPDAPVCSTPESYCTNWTHPNPPCSFPSTPVRQPLCVEVEE
jgi:hypothetical protein